MSEAKPFVISKWEVREAYKRVKANKGAAGVDDQTITEFEGKLKDNLYRIWNRMSSGSYLPPPVRTVKIPKANGGERKLGIPTVSDRIAQQVVKSRLEPVVDPLFHRDSCGYRPGKSALDAVGQARQRCWRYDWIVDLDIKGFFDNIPQDLLIRAVRKHAKEKWIVLCIERWLKAPVQEENGQLVPREKGTPQGGAISPLPANLSLHYAFDRWVSVTHPQNPFERFADDAIVHCRTEAEAQEIGAAIAARLKECGLELHPEKSGCFRQSGEGDSGGSWNLHLRSDKSIEDLSRSFNPGDSGLASILRAVLPLGALPADASTGSVTGPWAYRKYKKLRGHPRRATHWVARISRRDPKLWAHWQMGAGRGSMAGAV
jgi:RNA-directed DNA polymerase